MAEVAREIDHSHPRIFVCPFNDLTQGGILAAIIYEDYFRFLLQFRHELTQRRTKTSNDRLLVVHGNND